MHKLTTQFEIEAEWRCAKVDFDRFAVVVHGDGRQGRCVIAEHRQVDCADQHAITREEHLQEPLSAEHSATLRGSDQVAHAIEAAADHVMIEPSGSEFSDCAVVQ